MNWLIISSEDQLKAINERSFEPSLKGVAIFKHSTRCGISSMAKGRLEHKWDFNEATLPVYYLDLLSYRDLSNKIAAQYRVEHQSPQLLIIKDGKCIYTSSHSEISALEIADFFNN